MRTYLKVSGADEGFSVLNFFKLYRHTVCISLRTICVSVKADFYAPTSKKLMGHIGLGPSVCPSVRLSVTPFVGCKTREPLELGTFIYTSVRKLAYMYFFFRSAHVWQRYAPFSTCP